MSKPNDLHLHIGSYLVMVQWGEPPYEDSVLVTVAEPDEYESSAHPRRVRGSTVTLNAEQRKLMADALLSNGAPCSCDLCFAKTNDSVEGAKQFAKGSMKASLVGQIPNYKVPEEAEINERAGYRDNARKGEESNVFTNEFANSIGVPLLFVDFLRYRGGSTP
jgi:hypothetical protein